MQERSSGNRQDPPQSQDSSHSNDSPQAKSSDTRCKPSFTPSDAQPCCSSSVRNRSAPQSILKVRPSACDKARPAKCGPCKSHEDLTADTLSLGSASGVCGGGGAAAAPGTGGMLSTSAIKWGIGLMKEGLQSIICPGAGEETTPQSATNCCATQPPDCDPLRCPTQHSSCSQATGSTGTGTPPPPQCLSKRTSNIYHPQSTGYQQQACRPLKTSHCSANESSLSNCSMGACDPNSGATAKCHMGRSPTQSFYGDSDCDGESMAKQRFAACGSPRPRKCEANSSGYSSSDAKAAYECGEQKYVCGPSVRAGRPACAASDSGYHSESGPSKACGPCSGLSAANSFSSTRAGNGSLRGCSPCPSNLTPSHSNMLRPGHNPYGSQRSYGSAAMYPEYTDGRSCGARQMPANSCNEARLRQRSKSCGAPPESMTSMRSCCSQNSYNGSYGRRPGYPDDDYGNGAREPSASRGSYRGFEPQMGSTQRMRSDCSRVSFLQSDDQPGPSRATPQRPRPPDALQCQLAMAMAQAIQAQAMSRGGRCKEAAPPCQTPYRTPCATAPKTTPKKRQCPTKVPQPCSTTLDDDVMEKIWQLQVDNLVRDQYFPGTIQDTINGSEDFEELAHKVVALESKGAACNGKCPTIEPISLLEAFMLRIDFERNVVLDEIETTPEACGRAEPTLRHIEDHYCKRFHTELNEAIAALFKAEICVEEFETEPEAQKAPNFLMQMEKTQLKMPADPCEPSTSATTSAAASTSASAAAAVTANEGAVTSTVYMGMTIPNDEVGECEPTNEEADEHDMRADMKEKVAKAKEKLKRLE